MRIKRNPPPGNVRNVQNHGSGIRGYLRNHQNEIVQFESHLERFYLVRLLRDKTIANIVSQPLQIRYRSDGKERTYVPDFKVTRIDGSIEIHEVTILKRRSDPRIREREEAMRRYCQERGWRYVIFTDCEVNETEKVNLDLLHLFMPGAYRNPYVDFYIMKNLSMNVPVNLISLLQQIVESTGLDAPVVTGAVFHMLWHGRLDIELNRLIMARGEIRAYCEVWKTRMEE